MRKRPYISRSVRIGLGDIARRIAPETPEEFQAIRWISSFLTHHAAISSQPLDGAGRAHLSPEPPAVVQATAGRETKQETTP
jgi:hypothetical protein